MRFSIAFLILTAALFIQIAIGDIFNVWLGLVLSALIASSYFLNFYELVFNVLFAIFALNWQPGFSPEIIIFFIIPVLTYVVKSFFQFKPLPGILFFIFVAIFTSYLLFFPKFFVIHPGVFILDLGAGLMYGFITFWILNFSKT